jgi:hypothetical protein
MGDGEIELSSHFREKEWKVMEGGRGMVKERQNKRMGRAG